VIRAMAITTGSPRPSDRPRVFDRFLLEGGGGGGSWAFGVRVG
jgi:hypothetical protein